MAMFYIDNWCLLAKIGAGTFGVIYKAECASEVLAAKIVLTEKVDVQKNRRVVLQEKVERALLTEPFTKLDLAQISDVAVLSEFALQIRVHQHPNVATVHHIYALESAYVVLMDYFPQGDLFHNILSRNLFGSNQMLMKNCMLQLIDTVAYCASKGVFHCDLKPENIMVEYNNGYRRTSSKIRDCNEIKVSLIDFGLAITTDTIPSNACRGLSFYMAPERIADFSSSKIARALLPKSSKSFPTLSGDIWLLGVLFINIACARNPWPVASITDSSVFQKFMFTDRDVLARILPISRQFNKLLQSIFVFDPNERISLYNLGKKVQEVDLFNDQLHTPSLEPASPTSSFEGKFYL